MGKYTHARSLAEKRIMVEMTDFFVDKINSLHLIDKEMVVEYGTWKRTAQICIEDEGPTYRVLKPVIDIKLCEYELHLNLCGLGSLGLNDEQELKALRDLNQVVDAMEKKLSDMVKGSIRLVTDLRQILKEAEEEQKEAIREEKRTRR